jgi:hypothetical protein
MSDRIERELRLQASPDEVWEAVVRDGWLADEVDLDLRPGGDAVFRSAEATKFGWIEEVAHASRLTFWWAADGEPATRVELTLWRESRRERWRRDPERERWRRDLERERWPRGPERGPEGGRDAVSAGDVTRLRVVETRPLELLDLVATPLPGIGGRTYGPALVAA